MFWQDVRYAIRTLRKSPGFAAVAVLTLAIGIGANTAIFSVVNAVLLRPLPFADPDRLVAVHEKLPALMAGPITFSAPDYLIYQSATQTLRDAGIYSNRRFELSGIDRPERISGVRVSANLLPLLGIQPALGRLFTDDEDRQGRPVAILSNACWRRNFGADPYMNGRAILLDRRPYTVVGVMPRGMEFPFRGAVFNGDPADVYVPISFTREEREGVGNMFNHSVIGRLKPGRTVAEAAAEAETIAASMRAQYPAQLRDDKAFILGASVNSLNEEVVYRVRTLLLVLMAAVGIVLLIGCANVASLMLTRVAAGQREMAVRTALGASRARLVRQMLTESFVLSFAGGGCGILLALWACDFLVRLAPAAIPRADSIHIDARALIFTMLLSVATALFFGLAPAAESSRTDLGETLKEGGRASSAARGSRRIFAVLVTAQFALALLLLSGAGLLIRSFDALLKTDPGFRPVGVLALSTSLPSKSYSTGAQVLEFYRRLLSRARTLAGAQAVGIGSDLPLDVHEHRTFAIEGPSALANGVEPALVQSWTMGRYFEALGIPLIRGRFPDERDDRGRELVVAINRTMARKFWPGRDVIGKRIRWGSEKDPWMKIIGVVGDVKQGPLQDAIQPHTYTPIAQEPDDSLSDDVASILRTLFVVVRAKGPTEALASGLRADLAAVDPSLPVTKLQTMNDVIGESVSVQRFSTTLLALFAGIALFLASIGIYGVLAYSVTQRSHEIGVRMALGAKRGDVLRMVVRQGLTVAGAGLAIGLVAAIGAMRAMTGLLYGVTAGDPVTFASVVAVLVSVALLACYLPARRATKLDPIVALRYE